MRGRQRRTLRARFGSWHVKTPLANVRGAEITGPYRFIKTAGPARLAITDRALTFATNGKNGVRVEFHDPVRRMEPLGLLRHPELTVTVEDPEALITAIIKPVTSRARVETAAHGPDGLS
jgi:hypothetical protein